MRTENKPMEKYGYLWRSEKETTDRDETATEAGERVSEIASRL